MQSIEPPHIHIVMIAHSLRGESGGIQRFVSDLISALRGILPPQESVDVIEIGRARDVARGFLAQSLLVMRSAPPILKAPKRHGLVFHVHGYASPLALVAVLISRIREIPIIFTPHYHPTGNAPWILKRLFDLTLGRLSISGADIVVAVTEDERRLLMQFRSAGKEVNVIADPLPSFVSDKVASSHAVRKPLSVLFVGRLEPSKGVDGLAPIMENVWRTFPSATLTIVTPGGTQLETLSGWQRSMADDRVRIVLGAPDEELIGYYDQCQILLVPSRYEAFGLVAIEGQSRGMAVVAADVGGLRTTIRSSETGFLIPVEDWGGFAKCLTTLLADQNLREVVGSTGQRAVQERTPKATALRYLELYRSALRDAKPKL